MNIPQIEFQPMTSAELIKSVGPALFGRNWQSELADWLAVNRKTISPWRSGEDEPRSAVWKELLEITQERHVQLAELIKAIAERVEKARARAPREGITDMTGYQRGARS